MRLGVFSFVVSAALGACKGSSFSGGAARPSQSSVDSAPAPAPSSGAPASLPNDGPTPTGRESTAAFEARCETKRRVLEEFNAMGQSCGAFSFQILQPGDPKACSVARSAGLNASSKGTCKDLCESANVLDTSEGPAYCVYDGEILSL